MKIFTKDQSTQIVQQLNHAKIFLHEIFLLRNKANYGIAGDSAMPPLGGIADQ